MARPDDYAARPPAGERLCALADIADPGAKAFRFRDGDLLFAGFVVRAGELIRGFIDRCPHAAYPLGYYGTDQFLTKAGDRILCAAHGALFTLEGEGVCNPCQGQWLTPWEVEVRDGDVFTAAFTPPAPRTPDARAG